MLPKPEMINRKGKPPDLAEKTAQARRVGGKEESYSEQNITPEISLTVSAVLAAFTILAEDLSSLPLILYQRIGRVKTRAYTNSYYRLLHDRPNPEHSSMVFRELVEGHLLAWGNFYGQQIWDRKGDVVEVWPLRPDRMSVARVESQRIYNYVTSSGEQRVFLPDEILHIPAFGFDGLIGYSRISLARNAIGLSISAEKYGSKFFANGATAGVVIEHPDKLSDEAYEHLRDSWEEQHRGVDNAHKAAILEEGMKIEKIGIPPDDAQFLETRKFQVSEIARIFRVPPHMIGDVEKSTSWGSGIDSQEQGYVNHTLRPWATRIEEALRLQVLPEAMQDNFYYEHLMDALLRGDIAVRYEAYVKAIQNGILSPNEVRSRENMNPYKGGDVYWRPLNMEALQNSQSSQNGGSNNRFGSLDPLWRDVINRILKRETNDLQGALRRWSLKGQEKRFKSWAIDFYSTDHPAFIQKQLQPILEAEQHLFGLDRWEDVALLMVEVLDERRQQVLQSTPEELLGALDEYSERAGIDMFEQFRPVAAETLVAEAITDESW